jgi:hypothetical protein
MDFGTFTCQYCSSINATEVRNNHYYNCSFCNHVYINYENTLAKPEEIISESETMSPIIIGSKGKINGETFEVTGCVTLFQKRTTINLFSIKWNTGLFGCLLEFDGEYNVITSINENPSKELKNTKLGKEIEIIGFGKAYCYCIDKPAYIAIKGNGKLVFEKYSNSFLCSYYSQNKKVAFCFFNREHTSLLTGTQYNFNELNLSPTRAINDWHK